MKKEFINPEVLVHEMRKLFTQTEVTVSNGEHNNETFAPERLNTLSAPDAPEDVSGMKQTPWE